MPDDKKAMFALSFFCPSNFIGQPERALHLGWYRVDFLTISFILGDIYMV
jgi:hypothetical protein